MAENEISKENSTVNITQGYGILLTLTPEFINNFRNSSYANICEKYSDIAISWNGVLKEFSIDEFLMKLGF